LKILVVYEPGELGEALLSRLAAAGLEPTPLLLSRPSDVALDQLQSWVEPCFDLVINAITSVDAEQAEPVPQETRHRLHDLPVALAERAAFHAIAMMNLSSSQVFDGRKQQPYISSNPGNPLSVLGQCQWDCEQSLRSRLPRHLILRTGWSLERLQERVRSHDPSEPLCLSSRYRGQPTTWSDCARVMTAVVQQLDCGAEAWGTYQYAGCDTLSLYDLGLELLEELPETQRPHLIDEEDAWMRLEPANAVLNCKKIRHTFGIQQLSWRQVPAATKP